MISKKNIWPLLGVLVALLAGTALRLVWVGDMEYKADEKYMFDRVMAASNSWPLLGMRSGVLLRNPGMSVWIFVALGRLFGVTQPTDLVRVVQGLNILALIAAFVFAWRWVGREERESWFWGIALAAVNPILVMYHRKIWAQSLLPIFCLLFFIGWWKRQRFWGAFVWGLLGVCLGQIHMSGFFFALGFYLWVVLFRKKKFDDGSSVTDISWRGWGLGTLLGLIPLLPWLVHVLSGAAGSPKHYGLSEAVQMKYWVFWITDPFGLHLGNSMGGLKGGSALVQLGEFLRYPLVEGHPSYLMAGVHVISAGLLMVFVFKLFKGLWGRREQLSLIIPGRSAYAFAQNAAFFSSGALLTLSTLMVRRYYLLVTFPFEFVWLGRQVLAYLSRRAARVFLITLFCCEFLVSCVFLIYVHDNGGSLKGDYGRAYRFQYNEKGQRLIPLAPLVATGGH